MMAWIVDHKRHVTHGVAMAGLLGLGVAGVALSLPAEANFKGGDAKQAEAERAEAEDKVEAALYSRVMRMRGELAMTNGDLAALGLNEAQAEDVLTRLVEWVETNQAALIQADNAAEAARQQVAELDRKVRVGEAEDREAEGLKGLYRAVAEAEAVCKALRVQAGGHAITPAPGSVRAQWETAQRYAHLPLDMRHLPGLDERRVEDLLEAASDQMESSGGDIRQAQSASTRQSMDEVRHAVRANLAGVRAAEATALPRPSELQEDNSGMMWDDEAE